MNRDEPIFRRRFEALFQGINVPMQLYDASGLLLLENSARHWCNSSAKSDSEGPESFQYNLLADPQAAQTGVTEAFHRALRGEAAEMAPTLAKGRSFGPLGAPGWKQISFLPIQDARGGVPEVLVLSRDFTDTAAKEGSSEAELERARQIAETAPVAVQVYNDRGYSIYSNKQHSLIFGGPPPPGYCVLEDSLVANSGNLHLIREAFSGKPTRLPLLWYDARDLKDLNAADQAYTNVYGKKCAIETHMIPVLDGRSRVSHVVFIFKDVTGELFMRQEREVALKERDDTRKLIQDIFDQTQSVISIKDQSGRLIFANKQFERVLGRPLSEILGRTDQELFSAELAKTYQQNDRQVAEAGGPLEFEETAVHADGVRHAYLASKFCLEDSLGQAYGICGVSTDITRFRQLENELNDARRMESVGLLSGGVAHNFNNILGVILLVVDMILIKKLARTKELKAAIGTIRGATQSAAHLTRQLLTFGRRQRIEHRHVDLGVVARSNQSLLKSALSEDIRFSVEIEPDIWLVHADFAQLEQVLTNLCLNSRDAMPRGGRLIVSVRNLRLPPEGILTRMGNVFGDQVELAISDTGTGISTENLDRIFEPFFTTKKDGNGTGLGLATVYGSVQAAGGGLSVETCPGKGTTFRIYFPKAADNPAPPTAAPKMGTRRRKGRETLLLIEDQASLREVTAGLLREYGYRVMEARDGREALRLWRRTVRKPHLIITDVVMPGGSGLEVIRSLERGKPGRQIRVLFTSAYADAKLTNYDLDQGRHQFIEKPYSADEFLAKIRSMLRNRKVQD